MFLGLIPGHVTAGRPEVHHYTYEGTTDTLTITDSGGNTVMAVDMTAYTREVFLMGVPHMTSGIALVDAGEVFGARHGASSLAYKKVTSDKPVFFLFVNSSGDYGVMSTEFGWSSNLITPAKDTEADAAFELLDKYFNNGGATPYFKKLCARRDLLGAVDSSASLAYMEAQLDLLTSLVVALAEAHPEVLAPFTRFGEFKQILDTTSVLTVKTEDSCLSELSTGKARVRAAQGAYINVKNALNAS